MDPYLESYKKIQIDKLVSEFNFKVKTLNSQLLTNYNNIKKNIKQNIKIKSINILLLNKNYNSMVKQLQNNLNINIKRINLLTSFPQRTIPDKFSVLIGINYKNTPNELYGCINDTKNIQQKILIPYGFKNNYFLTDETSYKPTKQNIMYTLNKLLSKSISGDSLFISYSGHGTYNNDLNGDELDGQDELWFPIDATSINSCISDDELNSIITTNLKPQTTLFVLSDSCFSGTVLDLKYNLDSSNNIIVNPNVNETSGQVFMISGCSDNQTSADAFINKQYSGAMTYAFTQTIETYGTGISLIKLVEYMRIILKDNGFEQIPQLSWGLNIPDLDKQPILI
jgi:hypothetical protein